MKAKTDGVPIKPGTLLKMSLKRADGWFDEPTTIFGRKIPAPATRVLEVESFILDKNGGHVTFEREQGTYDVYGGGRIEDIKFPYPHAMFEVIDEAEAAHIRAEQDVLGVIEAATHPLGRLMRWLDQLRSQPAKFATA